MSYFKLQLINFIQKQNEVLRFLSLAVLATCLFLLNIAFSISEAATTQQLSKELSQQNNVQSNWAEVPLYFEEKHNKDGSLSYLARGTGYQLIIDNTGHSLALHNPNSDSEESAQIHMSLVGSQLQQPQGVNLLPSKINYLLGQNKSDWQANIATYPEIIAKAVYPGIDLRYHGDQQQFEYDFIVAPGSDTEQIRLAFEGIDTLSINPMGALVLSTKNGDLHHQKPIIYQTINGKRTSVAGSYTIEADSFQVGFVIGDYDGNYPLIIDPILSYASYLGGSGPDQGVAIAVDNSGNSYVSGTSFSVIETAEKPLHNNPKGRSDIFIAKLNPEGELLYATYLGGQDYDKVTGISVDDNGYIYITGSTSSDDFPVKSALQENYGGGSHDAFISKLSSDGSTLIFSTYIGGEDQDKGHDLTLDDQNNIYLTGETSSDKFPLEKAIQAQRGGHADAYLMKLTSDGSTVEFATYLGGRDYDSGQGIAVDSRGHATIVGTTFSEKDFPLHNALQTQHAGSSDAFITQLTATGTTLNYSTYLGGTTEDQGLDIAIDSQNNTVITGVTGNWEGLIQADDFPVKDALQTERGGLSDGFISKLAPDGDELVFSSYLGGDKNDRLDSIAIDSSSNIYVLGTSQSTDMPVMDAIQDQLKTSDNTKSDIYLAKLNSEGNTVLFASYFGGSKADRGQGVAVNQQVLYMTGITASDTDFPLKNASQQLFGGGVDDMFIAKIGTDNSLNPAIESISPKYISRNSHQQFTATGVNLTDVAVSTSVSGLTIFDVATTETQATFRISANASAKLGDAELRFSSDLGDAITQITVAPPKPVISISPSPIATAVNTTPLALDIRLSGADIFDHILNLSTSDSSIATIEPSTVTIAAGQTKPSQAIKVTSHVAGSVSLDITAEKLEAISANIFVRAKVYIPESGEHVSQSKPLGIVVETTPQPKLISRGPFIDQLTVFKESSGVIVNRVISPVSTSTLGISRGSVISSISPQAYLLDSEFVEMVITGQDLDDVDTVEIIPSDGITLGTLSVAADGKSVTIPVKVAEGAAIGLRRVKLSTPTKTILPVNMTADRIFIAKDFPIIDSIAPIIMERSHVGTLTIRGQGLTGTETITVIPADGITVSTAFSVNSVGTVVTAGINIDESAALGPRTIVVTTPAGSSTTNALAANTLTISDGPGTEFSGFQAPQLGLVKGDTETKEPVVKLGLLRAAHVGVSFGALLRDINPKVEAIGSTFTLSVQGSGLQNVDALRFDPVDGITINSLTANADGKTVTAEITIAFDAPQTLRKVIVSASGVDIIPVKADVTGLLITALQPKIDDVSPNYVIAGGAAQKITVRGQYLNNAQSVEFVPAEGLSSTAPVVNTDGTQLTVNITAASGTTVGKRLLKVLTPGGETSSDVTAINSVTVISNKEQVTPVYTAHLGIQKEVTVPIPTVDRLVTAPLIKIEKQQAASTITRSYQLPSASVGIALGAVANNISPTVLPVETETSLTISGFALDKVESISFVPAEGITQTAPFTVSADNTQLTLTVDVAADAVHEQRQIILSSATGAVYFSQMTTDRLRVVANALPQINAMIPIQQLPGANFSLVIHGKNLQDASAVEIKPTQGISMSTPTVTADGTKITVQMAIADDADIGDRVITIKTPAGKTSVVPAATNTFKVVTE